MVGKILLLLICAVGEGMTCSDDETKKMTSCLSPFKNHFVDNIGTTGTCNRMKVTPLCSNYSTIVNCVNNYHVNSEGCVEHIVMTIDGYLGVVCKVADFSETCTQAPLIVLQPLAGMTTPIPASASTLLLATGNGTSGSAIAELSFLMLLFAFCILPIEL